MASTMQLNELFDEPFLTALQHLSLRLSNVQPGGRLAEQKTPARGQGLEFADYKPYVAGDDLRAVDWKIYNRLGKVFVKVFSEQQDMPVYLLVDVSKSMFAETPSRIHAALRTALALSAISLSQHDSVGVFPFSGDLQTKVRSLSGKRNLMNLAQHLTELQMQSVSHLSEAITQFAHLPLRRGLLVILSDFFDDSGLEQVFNALQSVRHQRLLVQVTQPWDANPLQHQDFNGNLQLQDSESQAVAEVSITPQLLQRYQTIYRQFNQQLTDFSKSHDCGFVQLDASADILPQLVHLFDSGTLQL